MNRYGTQKSCWRWPTRQIGSLPHTAIDRYALEAGCCAGARRPTPVEAVRHRPSQSKSEMNPSNNTSSAMVGMCTCTSDIITLAYGRWIVLFGVDLDRMGE